jgi:TatD DNase family protein
VTREPLRNRSDWDPNKKRELDLPPEQDALPIAVVDSHCHLDIKDGDAYLSVEEALKLATDAGIDRVVQVGVDVESSRWSVEAAHTYKNVMATVALHPNEAPRIAAEHGRAALDDAIDEIARLAIDPRVRAIGETGLDFFRTEADGLAAQEESFRRHIQIAKDANKALVIHDRDAHDDVVRVLLSEGAPEHVVFHCFSGDASLAQVAAENGWFCSFSGTVTFKNSHGVREGLSVLPPELLLVETDAPFLTPSPFRGRPNASYLIPLTVRHMAEVRGMPLETLCQALSDNSEKVFGSFAS